ncbi:MAG: metallophosphoesterase family protein [Candidatus Acidiferrales bacterium]
MKIVIISDIHGNFDALSALPETYDELCVLGDLVNYGPQPKEVIDWVREKATLVVRGNHDQCIGYGDDPRCSPRFRDMAEATRQFSNALVTEEQKQYLRSLLPRVESLRSQTRFFLCHATPSEPLYEYRKADSEKWAEDCAQVEAEVILVGHTHIPFVRSFNHQILVNPGSLGQPKTGKPQACYAVWEDGQVSLRTYAYPLEKTIDKIRSMPIGKRIQQDLITVLESGGLHRTKDETRMLEI